MRVTASRLVLLSTSTILACGDESLAPLSQSENFEVPGQATQWLQDNVIALNGADPELDHSDLESLRTIVGAARVVALGEATHGTREFFQMKHRVLRFLVEEMEFNLFAIEASWPEVNRINDYVLTGMNDPDRVLSGQYFWTWNTDEVFAMMEWMRERNLGVGAARPVNFLGFDMQFPGMAMHNVETYLNDIDVDLADHVHTRFSCLKAFANNPQGRFPVRTYASQSQQYRDDCRDDLNAVVDSLIARQTAFEATTSPAEFAVALQSARLTQQYDDMESTRFPLARDRHMAENAIWLLDQGRPDAKIVLWAHNGHVNDVAGFMGDVLRTHYGSDLVIMGFAFDRGSFTAVTENSPGSFTGLAEHTVDQAPAASYEHFFRSAGMPQFMLDMRNVASESEATSWLAGPRTMRMLGCCYQPNNPGRYLRSHQLPSEYDVMIFFDVTTATVVREFNFPGNW